jgi:hypothetical protein
VVEAPPSYSQMPQLVEVIRPDAGGVTSGNGELFGTRGGAANALAPGGAANALAPGGAANALVPGGAANALAPGAGPRTLWHPGRGRERSATFASKKRD